MNIFAKTVFVGLISAAMASNNVAMAAQCTASGTTYTTHLSYNGLYDLLNKNMACVGTAPNFTNQEYHANSVKVSGASGTSTAAIVEYGSGSSGIQPTATIGQYTITKVNGGRDTVAYSYTAGGNFTYEIYATASNPAAPETVDFCDTTTFAHFLVNVQTGGSNPVACN